MNWTSLSVASVRWINFAHALNSPIQDTQTDPQGNFILSGIPEHLADSPKTLIKDFIKSPTQTPCGDTLNYML